MTSRGLILLLSFSFLVTCGCGKDQSPVAGPSIDVETALKPGMSPDEVFQLLGKPDRDETPEDYQPRVIRKVEYSKLGLSLNFHTEKGLGKVWVDRRWTDRPVQGYRVGDRVGPGELGFKEEGHNIAVHFESPVWPEGSLYVDEVEVGQGGHKRVEGKVRAIMLMDAEIHGVWFPRIGSGK